MAKVTTRVAGVASALVLVLGLFLVVSPGSSGAAPGDASGSAFGISASGLVAITPTPTSPPDATELSVSVPGVASTGVLTTTANLTGTAFTSTATVANANLGAGTVTAEAVSSTCTADGTTLTGDTTFVNLVIAGTPVDIPLDPEPNTVIEVPSLIPGGAPVATVVLNQQITSADGQTLTVNAISVELLSGTPLAQTVTVANSECTLAAAAGTTTTTGDVTTTTGDVTTTTGDVTTTTGDVTTTTGGGTPTPPTTTPPTTTPGNGGPGGSAPGATPVPGSPSFTG